MTISELHIQLDLQLENRIDILEDVATNFNKGYLFVDSSNGRCYLFDKNGNEDDVKKLMKIDDEMFFDSNIESIVIPNSVESIGNKALYYCESLESIIIPNSVKSIGKYAFYECKSLTSIKIPDSVKIIKNFAFAWCRSLESVIISDSIKSIGHDAFYYCKNLKSIEISDSVKWIGYDAFGYCESLKSLSFKRKTMKQVKAMENYPFGIEDESIIRCV